jgi:hypothetical protein
VVAGDVIKEDDLVAQHHLALALEAATRRAHSLLDVHDARVDGLADARGVQLAHLHQRVCAGRRVCRAMQGAECFGGASSAFPRAWLRCACARVRVPGARARHADHRDAAPTCAAGLLAAAAALRILLRCGGLLGSQDALGSLRGVMRSVVWCGVVWCGVVWCGVVWCGVVWCGVVWCGVVWCGVVWCGVVRCDAMRCDAMRCDAMRCDVM